MNLEMLLAVIAAGAGAGVLAGLLGIGGGFVFVPALFAILRAHGVPPELAMHLAVGSSLAAIVPTSLSSIAAHARRANVDWAAFRALLPGLVPGAALGALLAAAVSGPLLARIFGGFLVLVAVQLLFDARPAPHRALPARPAVLGAGAVIGTASAMIGIGGGTLTAPYLVWCRRPMLLAVGTAAAAGLPIAVVGATGFALTGLHESGLPAFTTGYIVWPAALGLGAVAMVTAPLGARLAHRLPVRWLQRVFALALAAVALRLWAG